MVTEKIQHLEAKIVLLENENRDLKSLLQKQVIFGNTMTEMLAKMDDLLEEKKLEIDKMTQKLHIPPLKTDPMLVDDEEIARPRTSSPGTSDNSSQTDHDNLMGVKLDDQTTGDTLNVLRRMHRNSSEMFGDLLWKFLLGLLLNRNQTCIKWTKNDWEFCFTDHEEVARLWGIHKRRPNMTYGKMSRALRHYYSDGIVTKCEEKFTYQFNDKHITALILNDS